MSDRAVQADSLKFSISHQKLDITSNTGVAKVKLQKCN